MQIGDVVLYTMEFDADTSYSPNVGTGIVTKSVTFSGVENLDLFVVFQNGNFTKVNVPQGVPGTRGSWYPKGESK